MGRAYKILEDFGSPPTSGVILCSIFRSVKGKEKSLMCFTYINHWFFPYILMKKSLIKDNKKVNNNKINMYIWI